MATNDDHIVVPRQVRWKLTVEFGRLTDGSMPAKDFLDSLALVDRDRLVSILEMVAEHDVTGIKNERIFKKERGFWAAKKDNCRGGPKGRKMVRVVSFLHRDRLILTHGFWKPPQSTWPESEFTIAEKIRVEILSRE